MTGDAIGVVFLDLAAVGEDVDVRPHHHRPLAIELGVGQSERVERRVPPADGPQPLVEVGGIVARLHAGDLHQAGIEGGEVPLHALDLGGLDAVGAVGMIVGRMDQEVAGDDLVLPLRAHPFLRGGGAGLVDGGHGERVRGVRRKAGDRRGGVCR